MKKMTFWTFISDILFFNFMAKTNVFKKKNRSSLRMEYCITVNPIPHSQYR